MKEASFFFNIGTPGREQKATIIAENNKAKRFLKFAQKPIAQQLVKNEAKILKKLESQNVIKTPRLINYVNNKDFTFILTDVIKGKKVSFTSINDKIFELLCVLGELFPLAQNNNERVFSHGDFCPWNMLKEDSQDIILIDWEMASFKSLGYDLFTYIFHTNFLINEKKEIKDIMEDNIYWIKKYFNYFDVQNYNQYLISFVVSKMNIEKGKHKTQLYSKYKQLFDIYG
ncbi:phosphotransferase [Algibacter mikhailovii]|uniref:Aminoglycoside phosphotransferase domain-containing protein n=1 Tax=Algibacter mikhailovii TaxID=425498 RepID=A0A918R7T8_9FLAO|nr:phosphotransferase [Algibacter mikhailovii]GGZ89257.1 hypothetical protein GCM10007028_29370 [Algibacter mikhailovii]